MDIDHRKLAAEYFNATWDLIDKKDRSDEEKFRMISMAHASRFHWGFVGNETNFSRGEWQISHVYALLGLGESALLHGERALWYAKTYSLGAFDMAFCHESIARAYKALGDAAKAEENRRLGIEACEGIEDKDDKTYALGELNGL